VYLWQVTSASEIEPHPAELARAIGAGEIVPWYQPIIDLSSGELIALEALARWPHLSSQVSNPATFVAVAERSDLIIELDRTVLSRALAELAVWRVIRPALRLSVNVSGRHLDQDDWLEVLSVAVRQAGLPPSAVDLELTETARPADLEQAGEMMTQARALGYRIWFDDFGTGWSTLTELVRLPADGLKLDRSFADRLESAPAAVLDLTASARQFGLKVTLEGITTPRQARLARELGCDYGQGFLWSPAVPPGDVSALLAAGPYVQHLG
jgi:EAL domain-containing protein (putative c-di-GMP-specific phosphodiesterase class I)